MQATSGSGIESGRASPHRKDAMNAPTPQSPRATARWIAAIALLGLAAGVVLATRQWAAKPPRPGPASEGRSGGRAAGDSIARALGEDESEAEKSRWIEEVPGFDLSGWTAARRQVFLRHANTRRCTCGCGYTLAACRVYDSSCDKSLPKVEALRDSVARGLIASAEGLREPPGASAAER